MRFYRNLGPIRFEGETNSLQIFSSQPSTCIFQPKQRIHSLTLFKQVANYYNNYLHKEYFRVYQEQNKLQSMVINECKKAELKDIDSQTICNMIFLAAKTIKQLSKIFNNRIGDFSFLQFRVVQNRKIFVYMPIHIQEDQIIRQNKQVQGIIELVNKLKMENNKYQELLIKKLKKCKLIVDVIEQILYFSNIYGETKIIERPFKLEKRQLNTRILNKSKRKFNLFHLDMNKSKIKFYSHHEHYSQPRKSSFALDISIPYQKLQTNSVHNSSTRSLFVGYKKNQILKNNFLEESCKNCKIKDMKIKEFAFQKQKILKKIASKLQEASINSINAVDQQKLFNKLRYSRRQNNEPKPLQVQFTKSCALSQLKESEKITQKSEVIQKKEELHKQISKILIQHPQEESSIVSQSKQIKLISQPQKLSFTDFKEIPTPKNESNQIKQFKNQKTLTTSKYLQEPEKKLKKKKKVPLKEEQIQNSEIQIVDLNTKHMQKNISNQMNKSQQKNELKTISDYTETKKNSWTNIKEMGNLEETKREKKQSLIIEQKLIKRQKNINVMGSAVANTTLHLQRYEKIFWELPMFFIYRAFYFFRVELQQQFQKIREKDLSLADLKNQNIKIKESVNKLIKIILKKLKKEDTELLKNIKQFLTLQPVNCETIMKTFIKEYIDSLTEAANSSYPQLSAHLLEIIDAYLVYAGVEIDFDEKEKAEKNKEDRKVYLKHQMKVLKKYL